MTLRLLLPLFALFSLAAHADDLESAFRNPPASARPRSWWHWVNGNITREGITADLEAMKSAGMGGAHIFNTKVEIPHGPVQVLSPEWRELMHYAFAEAKRLGLELGVHNAPGYTSSGGPWIKPEHSMQLITWTETELTGPTNALVQLPEPERNEHYYRDIAVLAFPAPDTTSPAEQLQPQVSCDPNSRILHGESGRIGYRSDQHTAASQRYVQLTFPQAFEARTLTLWFDGSPQSAELELQTSDDGETFHKACALKYSTDAWNPVWQNHTFAPVTSRWFRIVFTGSRQHRSETLHIPGIVLGHEFKPDGLQFKAGFDHLGNLEPEADTNAPTAAVVDLTRVLDLTAQMDASGKLRWQAPSGKWTVLRLGHTSNGNHSHQAPPEASGLEIDKCSREALDAFWAGMMTTLINDAGSLVGKSFKEVLIDSYEVGAQNWTPKMREEFRRRRGYDLLPFLPALAGHVLGSDEQTERFLWDFRRTLADLVAENYYGHMGELCRKHGLTFCAEAYGNGNFDDLACGGKTDVPMGEFWVGGWTLDSLKLASSIAHTRGSSVVGAESFTSSRADWNADPASLKGYGDMAFCEGINRYYFHCQPLQPWLDKFPGMTMGACGTHFDRTETWWTPGASWMQYIARCQAMLQTGRFVADICYFEGESSPAQLPNSTRLKPALPAGCDYDACDSDTLMQFSVKDGRLLLPSGMSYHVLALPESPFMTPKVLTKVRELVDAGATVMGPRPVQSPSLSNFPACDREVQSMAKQVWGDCDGKDVLEHSFGKGKVVWGKLLKQVLADLQVAPDFEPVPDLRWIHRRTDDADFYFVSNQRRAAKDVECGFRVTGRLPELWHPDTGEMETSGLWSEHEGHIFVPMHLEPSGSIFVVFRRSSAGMPHALALKKVSGAQGPQVAENLTVRKAVYEAVDSAASADVTAQVQQIVARGTTTIPVDNDHFGEPADGHFKRLVVDYVLDGKPIHKAVEEHQTIVLVPQTDVPKPNLTMNRRRQLLLETFEPAVYEVSTTSGSVRVQAPSPHTVRITGPWKVVFPPNWGAPPQVTLPQLGSWTDNSDPGIRFFSGTADYQKEFELPGDAIKKGQRVFLDLGAVKNFAAVTLNGKAYPALWKPPFRLDVSDGVRAGRNKLSVKVTNLWANRMIGDEQLPEDCEWVSERLKAWPEWLLNHKPRPQTGRFTFSAWHHYNKDSPLLESGLLGPVELQFTSSIPVQ